MGKRKLSRQQTRRIHKVRGERAARAAPGGETGPEREGLVVAHYGAQVVVESPQGIARRCHLRANLDGLVTGDRVVWCDGEPTGVVVARLERSSELARPDAHGRLKPVAANIDRIVIVLAPLPEPQPNLVDCYLVAAEALGIEPLILLNKTDLLEGDGERRSRVGALLDAYAGLGYRVLRTCAGEADAGELRDALRGRTSVIVGQSGVGKSTLVNRLVPDAAVRVGALSEGSELGTHTTTAALLFHLRDGGCLIDSPGIREFGLWHMSREQVEWGFREFRPFLGRCRFRDCRHREEPGCALREAVARGEIGERRLDSYRQIVAER